MFVPESLAHSVCECKYHIVFIPKYREKTKFFSLCKRLGIVFRELSIQKESYIEEWHLMSDHVHKLISIPPKYDVAIII